MFEFITTVLTLVDYYASDHSDQFAKNEGSYVTCMVLLAIYGLLTAGLSYSVFKEVRNLKTKKWIDISLHVSRTVVMIVVIVLFFMTKGYEVELGFWIVTNMTFFVVNGCYMLFKMFHKRGCNKKTKV